MAVRTHRTTLCLRALGCTLLLRLLVPSLTPAQQIVQHALHVIVHPDQHTLEVTDVLTLPESAAASAATAWHFTLHAGLAPVSLTPGVQLRRQALATEGERPPPREHYAVTLPAGVRTVTLRYQGTIHHAWPQQGPPDVWKPDDTPGNIAADGVYLTAATFWYPHFGEALLTFTLDVELPPGWEAISQGQRTRHERTPHGTYVRWEAPQPQENIYLIGGRFTAYQQAAGAVWAMVFLRTPDASLAQRYLDATAQYLHLYSTLIGPYPYPKFALVEHVWESGYGMPSFTLLGPRVIRLPFIVSTSYAHEILHNWWGNGVFVEVQQGNWAEGLTAYLADHLLQEQRGTAAAYRRATLQKYTDYVTAHQEIPLTAFQTRHSAATEAIGYGKALMLFHMLRQQIGDAAFLSALRTLYRDHLFRRVGFDALRRAFASVAGAEIEPIFQQWVTRPGAPELRVSAVTAEVHGQDHLLTALVEQVQAGPAYHLHVPIAVSLQGQDQAWQTTRVMPEKRLELRLRLPAPPWRLDIDPEFDLFRRLHHEEVPPALTQILGAAKLGFVLPTAASAEMREGYRQFAQAWPRGASQELTLHWDHELESLPADRTVWLLGWENRLLPAVTTALTAYDVPLTQAEIRLQDTLLRRDRDAVMVSVRHPANPQLTLAWSAAPSTTAMPVLRRKLPHYGTYSFLGFTGDEVVNVVQGRWPVLASPMSVPVAPTARQAPAAKLAPRRALHD